MLRTQPFMRDDTFLGVCQALGDDFGFNPNWLRLALAPAVIWNPLAVFGAYAALGILLALLHWIVPNPVAAVSPRTDATPVEADRPDRHEPELLAA